MNKVAVGVVAGAAVIGAVGFGTLVYPQMRAKQEVDKAIAELPQGVRASYQDLKYSLFSDRLILSNFQMAVQDGDDTLTSDLMVVNVTGARRDRIGKLHAVGLIIRNSDDRVHVNVDEINAEDLAAPQGILAGLNAPNPATISVKNAGFQNVHMTLDGEDIRLREIVVSDFVQADNVPLSLSFGIHGLVVDPKSMPDTDARDGLEKLGYDTLSLDMELSYAHNPDTKRLSVKRVSVGGDNIGRLALSFDLGNVETSMVADPVSALAAAQTATLEQMELRYDDASLAGRLFKAAATEAGMGEAELKSSLLSQVAFSSAQAPDVPLTKDVLDSAIAFINNPQSLSLRLRPARPLPLGQVMALSQDPTLLAQVLGMSVTANR